MRVLAPFLLLLFSIPANAQVRTWVSSQGLDTNSCSRSEPCRNFAAAIAAVASAGEVVALDSAGYGPVTVDKSVSLIAPRGVHAAIAPTTGNAILVNGPGAVITVRNLYLNSQGANIGILVNSASRLFVESSVVSGFGDGIVVVDSDIPLFVADSVVRDIANVGIRSEGPIQLDRVQVHGNLNGILSFGFFVARDSSFSANQNIALQINGPGLVQSSVFTGNGYAAAIAGIVVLSGCTIVGNTTTAIFAFASMSKIYLFNSTVTGNQIGIQNGAGSEISLQNNTIRENATDGVVTPMSPN